MVTPVKKISKTEASVDELKFAHRFILKKVDLTEDEWCDMLFLFGSQYALTFANMFGNKSEWLYEYLILSPPEKKCTHNWFWMWFKLKWMQDDYVYISQKVYQQPLTYIHWKKFMTQCQILECDLMSLLDSKQIITR